MCPGTGGRDLRRNRRSVASWCSVEAPFGWESMWRRNDFDAFGVGSPSFRIVVRHFVTFVRSFRWFVPPFRLVVRSFRWFVPPFRLMVRLFRFVVRSFRFVVRRVVTFVRQSGRIVSE